MGVEKITSKIMDDAKKKADEIIKKAEEEASVILKNAEEEAEKRKNTILKKGEKDAEMTKNRIIAEAKLTAKRMILEEKEKIIEMAIEKLREDLAKLPEKPEYKGILEKMIKNGAVSLGGGELIVQLNERDMGLVEDEVLWKLEKEIEEAAGKVTILKKGEPVKIIGGCIISTADGLKILNNSLEAVFERDMENIRAKITDILF
ncbi:V-type proton ATPase subunit E [Methanotorris formicicus]|uniref:A-type ATP synthase subunit E n=1 Tax=Methanotorris formicicus Mc-S-70 TaxID=647171 RepID=H1KWT4_9EURY|nr:V-type proton ATPase subunit E [Methanotorris formicicus]EHP89067.1 H+transporting two-sector ATPase E subunit [Methanotorris formicicus Mc-S-70]